MTIYQYQTDRAVYFRSPNWIVQRHNLFLEQVSGEEVSTETMRTGPGDSLMNRFLYNVCCVGPANVRLRCVTRPDEEPPKSFCLNKTTFPVPPTNPLPAVLAIYFKLVCVDTEGRAATGRWYLGPVPTAATYATIGYGRNEVNLTYPGIVNQRLLALNGITTSTGLSVPTTFKPVVWCPSRKLFARIVEVEPKPYLATVRTRRLRYAGTDNNASEVGLLNEPWGWGGSKWDEP